MIYIDAKLESVNVIGRLGENMARCVRFDISDTVRAFPGASFMLLNKRKGDTDAYPVPSANFTVDGGYLLWTVTSGDLTKEGIGSCEIVATENSAICKTEYYTTKVLEALDGSGTVPDPWKSWQQQVKEDADRAEAAAELLEHPGADAQTLEPGSQATAAYADGVFSFGIPRGADGVDGYSPTASVTKEGAVATIVITDKDGTTTATVRDGTPADVIDDTAGSGTTDKTWSANKLSADIGSKMNAAEKGAANGVAELDENGKVPSAQLPGYVDDVVEGYYYNGHFYEDSQHTTEITGQSGKIYVDLSTEKTYRWSGSAFIEISASLALGETDSTAYRGDRGATAYAAAVTNVESTPSSGSGNLITSGAVHTGLGGKADKTDTVLLTTLSMGRKANTTVGEKSTALGFNITASGSQSHAEGSWTTASGSQSHAEGNGATASGSGSHAEGSGTTASGTHSHAEGSGSSASGSYSHAEGYGATASGTYSHAEGYLTRATGAHSHAEGYGGTNYGAQGKADHAEGYQTKANSGSSSTSYGAHAEGKQTVASGSGAHAEGVGSSAWGTASHAEGSGTSANGNTTHAEGSNTTASGAYSHAEGTATGAYGENSHTEGYYTIAYGYSAHAEGTGTKANGANQHVSGLYNYPISNENLLAPAMSEAEAYDTTKDMYLRGSIVKVDNTMWIAHSNAMVKRPSPKYDTYNWHTVSSLPAGVTPQEWVSDSTYAANTYVKVTDESGNESYYQNHYAITTQTVVPGVGMEGTRDWYTISEGTPYTKPVALEIIGNGAEYTEGANIRMLDVYGDEWIKGNVHVGCNDDSTGGQLLVKEGRKANTVVGNYSTALGFNTTASGPLSHAEGNGTIASGVQSHAEGSGTTASGTQSHAEGGGSTASGDLSHAEGQANAIGNISHAEGSYTNATGQYSHAEGTGTTASGQTSHSEGGGTTASGDFSHAEGGGTRATAGQAHAEGGGSNASGVNSHAEGSGTTASGTSAHSEGGGTAASGNASHSEGNSTTASGFASHSEGTNSIASGDSAHSEGLYTVASGRSSHVVGRFNVEDSYSNWNEWVSGTSYAVGDKVKRTVTSDNVTTVTGYICIIANSDASFTSFKWTDQHGTMNYAEIVGNGMADNARSNARTLDWDGNERLMGDVYVGCNADSTGGTKLAKITDIPEVATTTETQAIITEYGVSA